MKIRIYPQAFQSYIFLYGIKLSWFTEVISWRAISVILTLSIPRLGFLPLHRQANDDPQEGKPWRMTLNFWSSHFCPSSGSWASKSCHQLGRQHLCFLSHLTQPEGLRKLTLLSYYIQNKSVNNSFPSSPKIWAVQSVIFNSPQSFYGLQQLFSFICLSFSFFLRVLFPSASLWPLWKYDLQRKRIGQKPSKHLLFQC